MRLKRFLGIAVVAALAGAVGCGSRKTTKIEEPVPEPTVEAEQVEEPRSEFVPSDEDVFETVDMDAAMREIFVPIYFDYDMYDLKPAALEKLERIARFLSENGSVRVLIEGHADERGSNEYNIGLGENRAKAVKNYLTGFGIDGLRLEYTSYGRERPAISNCPDEECHSKNRRVEWQLLQK